MNKNSKKIQIVSEYILAGQIDSILRDEKKLTLVIEAICNVQYYGSTDIKLIKLNDCQKKIISEFVRQYKANLPVRIMIAKSRRVGGSMISSILSTLLMMSKERFRAVVASHQLGRVSIYLRDLYHILLDYLPDELSCFRGKANRMHRGGGYGYTLTHNQSVLSVDVEAEIRGRATDYLHCSEAAFFKNLAEFLDAYRPTLPDRHGTFAILESTPHAYDDYFHRMYERALQGNSTYTPLFFSWQSFAENKIHCTEEERSDIMNSLHTKHSKFGNEVELVTRYDVTAEQLKWRRSQLLDMDLDRFRKEWPSSIEEAFSAADSSNVFDMKVLREMSKNAIEPVSQGEMRVAVALHHKKPPNFRLQSEGLIKIWHKPEAGIEYVAGSDHSQGKHDWNSLTVLQRMPLRLVATLHGDGLNQNIIPAEFAQQMFHLLKYYNDSFCAIEINDAGQLVAGLLQEWEYHNLLSHKNIFPEENIKDTGGWRNTAKTRNYGIEQLRYYIQNKLIQIPDEATLRELMHFIYASSSNDRSKEKAQAARKGQARKGSDLTGLFDDRVFSLISALLAHKSLPPPMTPREKAIEQEQTDQDILYHDHGIETNDDFDIEMPFGINDF